MIQPLAFREMLFNRDGGPNVSAHHRVPLGMLIYLKQGYRMGLKLDSMESAPAVAPTTIATHINPFAAHAEGRPLSLL